MPVVEIEVKIKVDGRRLPPFDPYVQRVVVTEAEGFHVEQDTGVGFVAPLGIHIDELQLFVCTSDGPVRYRFGTAVEADYLGIAPGGLVLVVGGQMVAGSTENVQVENPHTEAITLQGLTGGT